MERIRKYGDKVLRRKSKEVKDIDEKVQKIIKDMKEVLFSAKGIGLAAPQIGILKRIFLAIHPDNKNLIVVINPVIVEKSGKEIDMEGCLSFPGVYFSIPRAKKVVISGINEKGKEIEIEGDGLLARCFQHEIDHLNGVLIIDYATEEEKKLWKEKLQQIKRNGS